jgi:site-specific DNA recombinase
VTGLAARRELAAVTGRVKVISPYIRVSALMGRDDETFMSPDLQLIEIRRAISNARAAGQPLVEGPVLDMDIDETGRDFNREGIQAGFALKAAGEIDGIAVLDVSRVGRDLSETIAAIERFRAEDGVFISARERFDPTPEGDWMLGQLCGMAQFYSDRIAVGWRSVIARRWELGHHNGVPPTGYMRQKVQRGERWFNRNVLDPDKQAEIFEAFHRYDPGVSGHGGESATSIELDLGRRGVLSLKSAGTLKAILGNPFYIGQVRLHTYTGKAKKRVRVTDMPPLVTQGIHEPLLVNEAGEPDVELFDRVQERLARERITAHRHIDPVHALGGLAFCDGVLTDGTPCNKALVYQAARGSGPYLRCMNGRKLGCDSGGSVNVPEAEDAVRAEVRKLYQRFTLGDAEITASSARRAGTAADRARIAAKVAQLTDARADADADFYSGDIALERHRAVTAKLDDRLRKAQARLDALGEPEDGPSVEEFKVAALRVDAEWDGATPAQRNAMLRAAGLVRVTIRKSTRWREPVADRVSTTFTL